MQALSAWHLVDVFNVHRLVMPWAWHAFLDKESISRFFEPGHFTRKSGILLWPWLLLLTLTLCTHSLDLFKSFSDLVLSVDELFMLILSVDAL